MDSLHNFKELYTHAKRVLPKLKDSTGDFRDYHDFILQYASGESNHRGTTCHTGPRGSENYEESLTKFRKAIGDIAKDVQTVNTSFDVVISVMALVAGVFFVLLADGRGSTAGSTADKRMEKSKHGGSHHPKSPKQAEAASKNDEATGAKQELEESVIHQLTTLAAVVANSKMQIVDANDAACALFGYEKSKLIDRNVKVLMPPDVAEKHDEYVNFFMKSGTSNLIGETRLMPCSRKDGSVVNAAIRLTKWGPASNLMFTAFIKDMEMQIDSDFPLLAFQDASLLYETMQESNDAQRITEEAMAAQDDMLRNLSVPVIVADETMTILDINEAATKIFGYEHFEVKGKNVKTLMFDDIASKHDMYIDRHLKTGVNRIIGSNIGRKVVAKHKSGSKLQLVLNVGKSKGPDGETQFVAIAQDVTGLVRKMEEVQAEKEKTMFLMENQKKFLQDLAVGVIVADENMLIKDVNTAAQRIFGYADTEFIGRNVKMLMHEGDLKSRHDTIVAEYLRTGVAKIIGSSEGRQVTAKHANGSDIELILNVNRSQTLDDPPKAIFTAVFQDVTELTKKMRMIEKQTAKTTRLVENQQNFIQDLAVGVIVANKNMLIKDVNKAAGRIFGYPSSKFIGENVKMLMPDGNLKDHHDEIVAKYLQTGKGKIVGSFEGRQVTATHADGSDLEIILNVSKSFVDDPDDPEADPEPQFTAVFQDVTELSRKMKEIEKERERTAALVTSQQDFLQDLAVGVIVADKHMTIQSINTATKRVFGYTESEIVGQNVKMLMPAGDLKKRHDDIVNNYLRTGKGKIVGQYEGRQVTAKHKNGAPLEIILNVSKSMTQDDPPEPQFTAVFQDVTELANTMKEMEQQRKETDDLVSNQRQFLQDLAVGVVVADQTGTIEDVNTATIRMFGYSEEDLVGANVKILMPDGDVKSRHDDIIAHHIQTGEAKIIGNTEGRKVLGRHKDGSTLSLVINVSKSMTKDKQPKFTAVFQDISSVQSSSASAES